MIKKPLKKKGIILVETQRYGNKENDFLLVSLANPQKSSKDKEVWKSLLGIREESILIPIPKKEETKVEKTGEKFPKETKTTEIEDKIDKKETGLDRFFAISRINDEKVKNLIETINQKIKLGNKQLKSKIIETNKDLFYYTNERKNLICIHCPQKTREINIFLKELEKQETISDNWSQDIKKGLTPRL